MIISFRKPHVIGHKIYTYMKPTTIQPRPLYEIFLNVMTTNNYAQ